MTITIKQGDALQVLKTMRNDCISCVITSPPYYRLRDYGHDDQLGLEETPQHYVARLVEIMREVRRVLKQNGTLWLNLGDSYAGSRKGTGGANGIQNNNKGSFHSKGQKLLQKHNMPEKNLLGIPWRVALALQDDGWILRSEIIWSKPNPMPESVTDRCTKSHETIFMLAKSQEYYFDANAIMEKAQDWTRGGPGANSGMRLTDEDNQSMAKGRNDGLAKLAKRYKRKQSGVYSLGAGRDDHETHLSGGFVKGNGELKRNKRSVWTHPGASYAGAHFATYPPALIVDCIKAGCPPKGTVLDPFFGSGTTGMVARKLDRNCIGIELNPEYIKIAQDRLRKSEGLSLEFLENDHV